MATPTATGATAVAQPGSPPAPPAQQPAHSWSHPHGAAPDSLTPQPLPRSSSKSRRGLVLVGAAVLVLVLIGGTLVALRVFGGGGGSFVGGGDLPAAVTSEPEEQWSHDFDGDYFGTVLAVGDRTLLAGGDGGDVVALDSDGEEVWTSSEGDIGYLSPSGSDDYALAGGYEDVGGGGVLSVEDGEMLWWDDDVSVQSAGEAVYAFDYSDGSGTATLSRVDPDTGEADWSVEDVDSFSHDDTAVYVVADGQLTRHDADSGDEEWSVDLNLDSEEYASVAATGDIVAVQASDVTALDADSGDELWSEEPDDSEASLTVGAYSADQIYINETSYDDVSETSQEKVVIFDRDGEVGEIDMDTDEYFYGVGFESSGGSYFLNYSTGDLYDDQFESVGRYDGDLTPTDSGLYALESGTLRYYEYGESRAAWKLDVAEGDSQQLFAGDEIVLVAVDGELTAYR